MKRLAAACVLALLLASVWNATAASGASSLPDACAGVTRVDNSLAPTNGKAAFAAVFVHGITSSADMWLAPARDEVAGQLGSDEVSIVRAVARIPGVVPYTFDYHAASLRWVTDGAIAPQLARALSCLRNATGERVIVIAHSMGGLATLEAARNDGASSALGLIVTIGTPFRGSRLLSTARAVINGAPIPQAFASEAVLVRELIATCGQAAGINVDACGWLNNLLLEVPDSPAGHALTVGSAELSRLSTEWPPGVTTLQIAGDIVHTEGVWGFPRATHHDGDIAVTLDSATGASGTSQTITCQPGLVYQPWSSPCFHTNLPSNLDVVAATVRFIRANLVRLSYATRIVTPDGQIGPLQIDRSTEADVRTAVGPPDVTATADWGVPPPQFPPNRALGYDCSNTPGNGRFSFENYNTPGPPYCRTLYLINLTTKELVGLETTSPIYATARGTTVGMSEGEASRRESQPAGPSCNRGIALGNSKTRATVQLFVDLNPNAPVAALDAESNSSAVGVLFC